jgi:hypothetical protein
MFPLAFDITPEIGAFLSVVVGLGIALYYVLPKKLIDFIKEIWEIYTKK